MIHCCTMMRDQVEQRCPDHPDPFDCADAVVYRSESTGKYGLVIHDGGGSFIEIRYCPWCRAALPAD